MQSKGLITYRPTMQDRLNAFHWMKKYRLCYDDSLTFQSAISNNCGEIVSFDNNFNKIKEVKRIEP
jgi:predicted nucleic acid-binding protein